MNHELPANKRLSELVSGTAAIRIIALAVLLAALVSLPAAEAQAPGYVQVSGGGFHTCAIQQYFDTNGGAVSCWGENNDRQSSPPSGLFIQVSAGGYHTCGLRADHRVECWGSNRVFEFCDVEGGYCEYRDTWQATPPAGVLFKQVSAGFNHTCGITMDDDVDCWGDNTAGEATDRAGSYTQVSAGENHTCALTSDGRVECWGDDANGRAQGRTGPFTLVSAGGSHNCAVRQSDGKAECWGGDAYGQSTPPDAAFVQVSAGNLHTCGIRSSDHWLACWGYNFYGQVKQAPDGWFRQIELGQGHSCGVTGTNEVYCWGRNGDGQATVPNLGGPGSGVSFDFEGFHAPVMAEPALNPVKAGSTAPLKFSLGGDYGLDVLEAGYPASAALDCVLLDAAEVLAPVTPAGKSGLSYDAQRDEYTYVWKTEKAWAGTCRALVLQLIDGTEHRAAFKFR